MISRRNKQDRRTETTARLRQASHCASQRAYSKIRTAIKGKWQELWNKKWQERHLYNIQNQVGGERGYFGRRREDTIITRLRLRHTALNYSLYRTSKHESGNCLCGSDILWFPHQRLQLSWLPHQSLQSPWRPHQCFLTSWTATHCSPAHESAPEPTPAHESASEPTPANESAPEAAPPRRSSLNLLSVLTWPRRSCPSFMSALMWPHQDTHACAGFVSRRDTATAGS